MIQDDSSAPATKKDLQNVESAMKTNLYTVESALKNDLKNTESAMKKDLLLVQTDLQMGQQTLQDQLDTLAGYVGTLPTKEEMYQAIHASEEHILTAFENLRHDFIGIHTEKIGQHEDRIVALEVVTGLRK